MKQIFKNILIGGIVLASIALNLQYANISVASKAEVGQSLAPVQFTNASKSSANISGSAAILEVEPLIVATAIQSAVLPVFADNITLQSASAPTLNMSYSYNKYQVAQKIVAIGSPNSLFSLQNGNQTTQSVVEFSFAENIPTQDSALTQFNTYSFLDHNQNAKNKNAISVKLLVINSEIKPFFARENNIVLRC